MIRRPEHFAAPAEGAAFVELSERAALLARLIALDLGVDEGELIEDLIAAHARALGLAVLIGRVEPDEGDDGEAEA